MRSSPTLANAPLMEFPALLLMETSRISGHVNLTFLYLGAVYFLAVYLWRRSGGNLPWRVAALFYLLTLGFLFQPLTQRFVNVPADYTLRIYPWTPLGKPAATSNTEINDVILQMVPWAHQVRESWKKLQVPLWNEAAGGGYPLLGNGQSAALSPLRLLGLPLPLGYSLTFEAALKILGALTFAFLYARRRYSLLASVFTAVTYGFSTFIVVWLYFQHSSVAAFLPMLFLGLDLVLEKATYRRFLLLVGAFVVLLLTGHPESAAHCVFAASLYVLHWLVLQRSEDSRRKLLSVVAAGFVSLLISMPFIAPLLEAVPRSQRFEWLEVTPHPIIRQGLTTLVPFFQVGFYGSIREQNIWGPAIAETLCGYAGVLGFFSWLALLAYVVTKRLWRERISFYVLATPLLTAIVMGWPLFSDAFQKLPLFSLAANGRLRLALCWFLAVCGGAVVDLLVKGERRVILATCAAAVLTVGVLFATTDFPHDEARQHAIATTIPRALVVLAAAAAAFASSRFRTAALWILVATAVGDLWSFGYRWNPTLPARQLYPQTQLTRKLQSLQRSAVPGEILPFRIAATGPTFFPNSAGMYGLQDIRSHDPMANGRVLGALRVFTGYSSFDYFAVLKTFDHPFIDYLNVRYLVTSPNEDYVSDRFIEIYSGKDGKIYRNRDALPRFYAARNVFVEFDTPKRIARILQNRDWANSVILERIHTSLIDKVRVDLLAPRSPDAPLASVHIKESTSRRFDMEINAPRWTLIVGSQPNWPGWKVYRNEDEPLKIMEVNAAFISFIVPPGKSNVSVIYEPRSFSTSALLSFGTMVVLLLILWRRRSPLAPQRDAP